MSVLVQRACESDLSALELILAAQTPPFEGRYASALNRPCWFETPVTLFESRVDYFGPVARNDECLVKVSAKGLSKADVAETTNVVWVDLDPPPDVDLSSERLLIERAERQLAGARALGLAPSVSVFSGRGSWCYWKLDRHVRQDAAEGLMKRLYAQFRPEGSEWDISRIARMPGSVNPKTGFVARVLSLDGVVWAPDELAELLPEVGVQGPGSMDQIEFDPMLQPSGSLPVIQLPEGLTRYLAERPPKQERQHAGIDGSAREQSIINRLVNGGFADGQIALFFDHHQLPRHMEERRKRRGSYSWLSRSIAKSRVRLAEASSVLPPVSIGNGTYSEAQEEPEPTKTRQIGWSARRWSILHDVHEGARKTDVLDWIMGTYEIKKSQARRDLAWLEDNEFIRGVPDERDKRVRRVYRTEKGNELLAGREGKGAPFSFLKGLPTKPTGTKTTPTKADRPDPSASPPRNMVPVKRRSIRDEQEFVERAEIRRRQRGLINGVYRVHIPGDRWTYFQLVTPISDWRRVRLHEQLPVAQDEIGLVYQSFISPKDKALGGELAYDPVEERTLLDGGWPARDKYIGVVAELNETDEGFRIALTDQSELSVPRFGVIAQSPKNFYDPLRSKRSLHDEIIGVRKRGQGKDTFYEWVACGPSLPVPRCEFNLDAFLDELADPDAATHAIESLPPGWYFKREKI